MRKPLALLLSLVLLSLCVFNACNASTPGAGVLLQPTDELVLYHPYFLDSGHWVSRALDLYDEQYPHVKVTVELFRIDPVDPSPLLIEQYERRMSTELLAGEGPDVVFLDAKYFDNIDKLAASGYFADLNPYFETDPDFDADNYYQPVFDAGLVDGKRAYVPYHFWVQSYVSSEERMRAVGIDPARITDMVSLLEEAGKALPLASQNPGFAGLFSQSLEHIPGVPEWRVYEQMLTMVGSALARQEAGESYLDSGFLRTFLTALKPCYQYAQRWQEATPSVYHNTARTLSVHQVLAGEYLFVPCPGSSLSVFSNNAIQDGVAYNYTLDDKTGLEPDTTKAMFDYQTPKETPLVIPFTNPEGTVQAMVSDAVAINKSAKNTANAYSFIKMLIAYREENAHIGYDLVSKELNYLNAGGFSDIETINPEKDLLAAQVQDVVFENPMVVSLLKECMLPFLNDEESYENCEADLRERLTLYWGE